MIKSFLPSATVFTTNGERIIQAIKCVEHRELGDWYVDLIAPLEFQAYLQKDYILVVPTKEKGDQPFRINNPKITDKVDVRAYHIGFDTKNYAVELSTVLNGNAQACLNTLSTSINGSHPFTFTSSIATPKSFSVVDLSLYNALIQIADEYNGILDFNGWNITISTSIGADNGVVLAYGKNIQESEINENWDLVVTKLKPIGNDGILLTPAWLTADVSYSKPYTKIMNFDTDNLTNLALVAQLYLDRYKVPRVNYKVKADPTYIVDGYALMSSLTHTEIEEYSHIELEKIQMMSAVGLGDTVTVRARQFTTTAEVLSYDYNPLIDRVLNVEFGNFRPTLKQFFSDQAQLIEDKVIKKAYVRIDNEVGDVEVYADNQISLAVGTAVKAQESSLPYSQDTWEVNAYSVSTGLPATDDTYIRTKLTLNIPILPSIDVVISCSSSLDYAQTSILFYNSSDVFLGFFAFTGDERKITTPATASYFRVRARKSGGGTFTLDEMPNHTIRVVPVGKYLKGTKFTLDENGGKFYGDGFKLYDNSAVLKVFFDLVKNAFNLSINANMPIYEPTGITELVQIMSGGTKGLQFGEPDGSGWYKAYITAVNMKTIAGLLEDEIRMRIRSTEKLELIGDDGVYLDGALVDIGDVVHMTFGATKYLITRDGSGFLKATTTV